MTIDLTQSYDMLSVVFSDFTKIILYIVHYLYLIGKQ